MSKSDFQKVTGETSFPDYLQLNVNGDKLEYYCNTRVSYTLRGLHIKLDVLWNFETPAGGGDTHLARLSKDLNHGSRCDREKNKNIVPNSTSSPTAPERRTPVLAALKKKVESVVNTYPGIEVSDLGKEIQITIPETNTELGHEAHFAQVTNRFLEYLKNPKALPGWEKPNMIAKYYTTTKGLELSRQGATAKK